MAWSRERDKIIKNLKPIELFQIVTRGVCVGHEDSFKKEIVDLKGKWFLDNWGYNQFGATKIEIDLLGFYLSDHSFHFYTTKEESDRLSEIFKSWGLFDDVFCQWWSCKSFVVGFRWGYNTFDILHKEWLRDKKLSSVLL